MDHEFIARSALADIAIILAGIDESDLTRAEAQIAHILAQPGIEIGPFSITTSKHFGVTNFTP